MRQIPKISMDIIQAVHKLANSSLCKPTLAPIVVAALTLTLLVPATRLFISSNLPLTVRNASDIRAYMSMRLLEPRDERPAVFNLGGSSLLRAVDEDAGLERRFDHQLDIYNLTNPSQSMVESWMLLKKIPLRSGDLVVMHVNISRFNNLKPLSHWMCSPYFYTITPEDIASLMREVGVEAEINPMCHLTWLSRRALLKQMIKNSFKGVPAYKGVYPLPVDRNPVELQKMRTSRLSKQNTPDFAESWLRLDVPTARANADLILRMHRYATSNGAHFVLLDPPMNHEWFTRYHGEWFPFENEYQQITSSIRKAGLDYRDMRVLPQFGFEDYYDQAHFIEQGREKFFPIYKNLVFEKLGKPGN